MSPCNQEQWFESKLDDIARMEYQVTLTPEYMDDEQRLESTKHEFLSLVPECSRDRAVVLYNQLEEIALRMYNLMMKAAVCAVEFDNHNE